MTLLEELKDLGVDIEGGLKRLGGNEQLYTRLMGSFVKTIAANTISPDFDAADCAEIIEKAHTIKGTAGNLSITPLFKTYTEILGLLRSGNPEDARQLLEEILPQQEEIISCIKKHMG